MSESVAGMSQSAGGKDRAGAGLRIGAVVLVLLAVVVFALGRSAPTRRPFDTASTSVDGYGAVRTLLEQRGVEVNQVRADDSRVRGLGAGDVLVVPAPALASESELKSFVEAAERGATVVLGSAPQPRNADSNQEDLALAGVYGPTKRQLADEPIQSAQPGLCQIEELADLGEIDVAFAIDPLGDPFVGIRDFAELGEPRPCFGTPERPWMVEADVIGDRSPGRVVVLASPYLWVNARLQPAKELGGPVPDNAATAVRLLHRQANGSSAHVTFVRALRTSSSPTGEPRSPLALMPFGVKAALAQLAAAFAVFVWWRSRRLGAAMVEPLPVEIAGSELVVAVGGMRYRRNDTNRAAKVLRQHARRSLSIALGIPLGSHFEILVAEVARRLNRPADQVRQVLGDGPVASREALVQLSQDLESLHMETQDVP